MENPGGNPATGAVPHEFSIRPASAGDAGAILRCLRAAFEPYRSQYTPQAYLDTVMTPEVLLQRLQSMAVLVAVDASGRLDALQVAAGCGPGRTMVNGVCVARITIRQTRREVRRCLRWNAGVCAAYAQQ